MSLDVETDMCRIGINAFGPLHVRTESEVLDHRDLAGKKPRLLLERLLVSRDAVVHKSAIADALWPRNAPRNASATIESYVSLLRKRLFADREVARQVIVTSREGYRLDTANVDLDLDCFDTLTQRADELGPGPRSLELRLEADALRRGTLLEDAVDEQWIDDLRRVYHDRASNNLVMIAEAQLDAGVYSLAIRSAESAIQLEPYCEEAFRVLMLAHYALGHHSGARKAFERLRDLVWTDLSVDLTSVTEDLAAAIDAGVPPADLIAGLSRRSSNGHAPAATIEDRSPAVDARAACRRMPFLGREAELMSLHRTVDAQPQSGLQLVMVRGARGIGKTALLNRFEGLAPAGVGRVSFRDLCTTQNETFAPGLVGALRQTGLDAGEWPATSSGAPLLAVEGLLTALAADLRSSAPVTLLLDDLDRAPDSDIAAIAWLRANAPEAPLTIVGSMTPPSQGEPDGGGLRPDRFIDLGPLTASDVASCGSHGRTIREQCDGHPLFMADLWRWRAAGLSGPPDSLLTYVESRVHTLNDPFVDALSVLTNLCSPAELADLVDDLQLSVTAMRRGLEVLVGQRPAEQAGEGNDPIRGAA